MFIMDNYKQSTKNTFNEFLKLNSMNEDITNKH